MSQRNRTYRVNSTGRKRIYQNHAKVTLQSSDADRPSVFDLDLNLDSYGFPPDAYIKVAAFHGLASQSWKWGTIREPAIPPENERILYMVPKQARFRISVVEAMGSGKLLGTVEIKPSGYASSLIATEIRDLGNEAWKIEFPEDDRPILVVNGRIPDVIDHIVNGPESVLILGHILRTILQRALLVDKANLDDDSPTDQWSEWLRFLKKFTNDPPPRPPESDRTEPEDMIRIWEWIDEVVTNFCDTEEIKKRLRLYNQIRAN